MYDIIIDDGYHGSKHQQISFNVLWDSVKSGGYYIIEDLHYQPEIEPETLLKTKQVFLEWKQGNYITTEYMDTHAISQIEYIEFSDSHSKNWDKEKTSNAFVFIKKK